MRGRCVGGDRGYECANTNWCDGQILRSQPWPIVVCMNKLFKDCVLYVCTVKEGERGEVCEDSRKVVVYPKSENYM